MNQPFSSNDILEEAEPLLREHLDQCLSAWGEFHQKSLADFKADLERFLQYIDKLPSDSRLLPAVWEEAVSELREIREWISAPGYISGDTSEADICKPWEEKFAGFIQTFPEKAEFSVDEGFWQPQPEDSLRVKIWKFLKRFSKKPGRRTFSLPQFSECYLALPFSGYLLEEWENYLHLAARHISQVHRISQELNSGLFFFEDAETVWRASECEGIDERLKGLKKYLTHFNTLVGEVASHERVVVERFREWLQENAEIFRKKWCLCGTYALPDKALLKRAQKDRAALREKFEKDKKAWLHHYTVERENWQNEISLQVIQLSVGSAYFEAAGNIEEKLNDQILPTFRRAQETITASLESFRQEKSEQISGLSNAIIANKKGLLQSLRQKMLPAMMDSLLNARFEQILDPLLERAIELARDLPAKQVIFRKEDLKNIPPKSETINIPFKELFNEKLLVSLEEDMRGFQKGSREEVEKIIREISEVDQVVEFNLDAALRALAEKQEAEVANQIVEEGLSRAGNIIEQFIRKGEEIRQNAREQFFQLIFQFIKEVQDLLDSETLIKLEMQLVQAKARERFKSYRQRLWKFLRYFLPLLWSYARKGLAFASRRYAQFRKITGLAPAAPETQEALSHYLTETKQKIASLPYVYQRLFENEPLTDERFFSGRSRELEQLKEDFMVWQQGRFMATAIIGERGSGRTTLLNFAEKDIYSPYPIREIDILETIYEVDKFIPYLKKAFPSCKDEDSFLGMEKALQQLQEPLACVVENIQNLYLKTVDGFDLLEQFMLLISRTYRKVYWVLTCTLYSWKYLDKVIGISHYFQRVLVLGGINRQEMENIIMKRQRVTGYQLLFEVPAKIRRSRHFKKLTSEADQQNYLKNMFFEQLQEMASGNVAVAMLYWLRAIQKIDRHQLILSPQISFDYSFLYQLSGDELFTLGTLMQHEMLTPAEHARVFHQSEQQSVLLFDLLINMGILVETTSGYRVHPFLYRPVVQALKRNNIIH